MSLTDDPNDTEADEKPSGIAKAEDAPAASVVNRTLRMGASAASALGERLSKTANAVTPLAGEVRKTTEAAERATRNIDRTTEKVRGIAQTAEKATRNIKNATHSVARTAERTSLGIADRLTTVLILCIQALWGGLAFTVVILLLAYGVESWVALFGTLLWVLGAAIIAFTPRALRAGSARRRN
ncbi:MAG: hypothetical protein OXH54_09465 [Acidimicrobiaceae bacterium]|nr:hypothetical protein [Acidimicrobiaceae bacterium]MYE65822.1 hypothetical protein [Acidimicrobiaceae bacterium]